MTIGRGQRSQELPFKPGMLLLQTPVVAVVHLLSHVHSLQPHGLQQASLHYLPEFASGILLIRKKGRLDTGFQRDSRCFPGNSDGKESACNVGDLCSIPGLGRSPGGEHGNPLQCSCLENPQGQRSLEGYSPRGRKESDMT